MGYIKIHQDKVTPKIAKDLQDICPFSAFDYIDAYLSINAACKVCKICVKKGPEGICEFVEDTRPELDRDRYKGIAVYLEHFEGHVHPVAWELIGKARELAAITKEPVLALVIAKDASTITAEALAHGVDEVHVYEDPSFEHFDIQNSTACLADFQQKREANIILFGGTTQGRSFAPRVAARLRTGLTADCTRLDLKENGDLLQIRPAFGGNIMAKIHTPHHRPQLATIRYKTFTAPAITDQPWGRVVPHEVPDSARQSQVRLEEILRLPAVRDISEADIIIAVGRGFRKQEDLALVEPLRARLQAELACTRPLIENGWFDPRRQIGLSGRTVKPRLIINIGISGAIQYIEGMKESDLILTIDQDPDNALFAISHYAIVGDLYEILPQLDSLLSQLPPLEVDHVS
jgi:electron transfer flavoprotein alpha subunit